jgi:hypothetical protein
MVAERIGLSATLATRRTSVGVVIDLRARVVRHALPEGAGRAIAQGQHVDGDAVPATAPAGRRRAAVDVEDRRDAVVDVGAEPVPGGGGRAVAGGRTTTRRGGAGGAGGAEEEEEEEEEDGADCTHRFHRRPRPHWDHDHRRGGGGWRWSRRYGIDGKW